MDFTWLSRWQPQFLAILRIVVALLFIEHATIKLFGFPPGGMPGPQPIASLLGRKSSTNANGASCPIQPWSGLVSSS
jgi:uncharacterized membrane protein YphA (DoxX/SURF4 family)